MNGAPRPKDRGQATVRSTHLIDKDVQCHRRRVDQAQLTVITMMMQTRSGQNAQLLGLAEKHRHGHQDQGDWVEQRQSHKKEEKQQEYTG